MSQIKRERPVCRAICWILAIGLGGGLGYYLIVEMGQDQMQSGVLALVAMLMSGIILRRLLCRSRQVAPARVEAPGGERKPRRMVPRTAGAAVAGGAAAAAIRAEATASGKQAMADVDGLADRFDDEIDHHLYAPLDELVADGSGRASGRPQYAADMVEDEDGDEDILRPEPDVFDDFDDAFEDDIPAGDPEPLSLTEDDAFVEPAARGSGDVDDLAAEIHAAVVASAQKADRREARAPAPVAAPEPVAVEQSAPAPEPAPAQAQPAPAPSPMPAANGAADDMDVDASDLTLVEGIDETVAQALGGLGITSLEDLAGLGPKNVRQIVGTVEGVDDRFTVRKWINGARALLDAEENG